MASCRCEEAYSYNVHVTTKHVPRGVGKMQSNSRYSQRKAKPPVLNRVSSSSSVPTNSTANPSANRRLAAAALQTQAAGQQMYVRRII